MDDSNNFIYLFMPKAVLHKLESVHALYFKPQQKKKWRRLGVRVLGNHNFFYKNDLYKILAEFQFSFTSVYIYIKFFYSMYIRRPNKHTSLICPNLGHTKHTFLPCRFSEIKLAIFQFTEKQTRHRPIRVHQTTRLLIPVLKTIISHTTAHIFFMIF